MDPQSKKAQFRAMVKAKKKENRIVSPLIRYNELDQPICQVCNVALKSESLWDAHQASRKHHEAISNMKAKAAGMKQANNVKTELSRELSRFKPVLIMESSLATSETSENSAKPRSASGLPPNFFDNHAIKRQKSDVGAVSALEKDTYQKPSSGAGVDDFPTPNGMPAKRIHQTKEPLEASSLINGSESEDAKKALPAGFFDNKEADLRARGIKPVKVDLKDEYSEFEKLIQEDLKEIDNRFEEEEIDAAETIEEAESFEQKKNRERVEMLKRKKMELVAARTSKQGKCIEISGKESSDNDESSSDDDHDEKFALDWRAQHI